MHIIEVIGREETAQRIGAAIDKLRIYTSA